MPSWLSSLDTISEIFAKTVIYKRRMVILGIRDRSSFARLRDILESEVGEPLGVIEMFKGLYRLALHWGIIGSTVGRMVAATACRILSIRFASGVHADCWPRVRIAEGANPPQTAQENLPSLHDIFTTPIFAKDHLPVELWPQIRSEYARLLAGVVTSNRWDASPAAVDHDIPSENAAKERARRVWTELLMVPKSVSRQNKRG